jgi:methionine-rich copper-binding protein CopC
MYANGNGSLALAGTYAVNGAVVTWTPTTPLPGSTQITVYVDYSGAVQDLAGNNAQASASSFTTAATADTTPPTVTSVVPANPPVNASNVPVNVAISLQASAPIDPTTLNSNTFLLYDQTLNQVLAGNYSESPDGTTAFFVPNGQLATGRSYTVTFNQAGMTNLVGNLVGVCCGINNYSFTTGVSASTSAPQVTGVSPANGISGVPINAQITLQFNEPVNSESLSQVTLSAGGKTLAISKNLSNGNQTLTILPAAALLQNTAYSISVAGVTDLAGNVMAAGFSSSFTTGTAPDLSTPSVISIVPSNQSTGVSTAATVQVAFSKFMNRLTISTANFTVSTNGNSFVSGTISGSADGTTAVFTPSSPLNPTTVYTVQLTSGITDLEGQALSPVSISFTTGTQ